MCMYSIFYIYIYIVPLQVHHNHDTTKRLTKCLFGGQGCHKNAEREREGGMHVHVCVCVCAEYRSRSACIWSVLPRHASRSVKAKAVSNSVGMLQRSSEVCFLGMLSPILWRRAAFQAQLLFQPKS